MSDLLQFFESKRQFQIILFLLIGSGTALSQFPPFQFLQKPGPYPVGLKVVNQYDPSRKFPAKPSSGKASIEAFFTAKGNDTYAILPRWSGHNLVIKDLNAAKSVALLGSPTPVKFKPVKSGLAIELPDLPDGLRAQPAWVLRITLK